MTTAEGTQIVTFRLGDDLFAADIFSVERVLRHQEATAIPNVPEWIEGVIDYRGRVVPVINLRRRFGLPPKAAAPETRVLVFTAGEDYIAGAVDAVLEVASLERAQVVPPPPLFRGLSAEYLRGIVRRNDRLIIFLEVERLLSTTERLALEAAVEEAVGGAGSGQPAGGETASGETAGGETSDGEAAAHG